MATAAHRVAKSKSNNQTASNKMKHNYLHSFQIIIVTSTCGNMHICPVVNMMTGELASGWFTCPSVAF